MERIYNLSFVCAMVCAIDVEFTCINNNNTINFDISSVPYLSLIIFKIR